MTRFLKFLSGILLLPLCAAVTLAIADVLRNAHGRYIELACLLAGYFVWLLCWFVLPQPIRVYILGHELTHALWAMLFGGRAKNLRVSAKGGSVRVTKSNVLITLAPYFFPFYTIVLIVIRVLLGFFFDLNPYAAVWLFLVGFTWSFHFTFTLQSLTVRQPDIQEHGRLFSYVLIYLLNILGIGLWVVCTTSVTVGHFTNTLASHVADAYLAVWHVMCLARQALVKSLTPNS
ncbi:MAG: hypothetical protein FWH21_04150 [Kiritimatiellaeota bacterium]|nr:hypothetical protein [Kiritimatiellota bacterium]